MWGHYEGREKLTIKKVETRSKHRLRLLQTLRRLAGQEHVRERARGEIRPDSEITVPVTVRSFPLSLGQSSHHLPIQGLIELLHALALLLPLAFPLLRPREQVGSGKQSLLLLRVVERRDRGRGQGINVWAVGKGVAGVS